MNGYVCLYEGRRVEVRAETPYAAKQQAILELQAGVRKKVQGHMVSIMLAEVDGRQVTHVADW